LATHNLSALIFLPWLGVYGAVRVVSSRNPRALVAVAALILIGALIAAFYWLPAIVELPEVRISTDPPNLPGFFLQLQSPRDLVTPDLPYQYERYQRDFVVHPVPIWQAILLVAGLCPLLYFGRRRDWLRSGAMLWCLVLAGLSLFLMIGASAPVWRWLVAVQIIQFPYRLLGPVALATAFLTGGLLAMCRDLLNRRTTNIGLFVVRRSSPVVLPAAGLVVFVAAASLPELPRQRLPLPAAQVTLPTMMAIEAQRGLIGTGWIAEYLPNTVKTDREKVGRPVRPEDGKPPAAAQPALPEGTRAIPGPQSPWRRTYRLSAPESFRLALHQFQFAGWTAIVDGRSAPVQAAGPLGLVSVAVPAGEHEVSFSFTNTPSRNFGAALSLAGLALLSVSALAVGPRRLRPAPASLVALLCLALPAGRAANAATMPVSVDARVGDLAALAGYRLEGAPLRPGGTLRLTLYWLSLRAPERDYQVFVHLAEAVDESKILAQHDGTPGYGYTPTSRWYPGEIVEDVHLLPVPAAVGPGPYRLVVGLYDLATVTPLPVVQSDQPPSQRALLATLESR
jgi:hypothetical protein